MPCLEAVIVAAALLMKLEAKASIKLSSKLRSLLPSDQMQIPLRVNKFG